MRATTHNRTENTFDKPPLQHQHCFHDRVSFVENENINNNLSNISNFRSSWCNNPHFNGTYSFQTIASNVAVPPSTETLATPIVDSKNRPLLQFAGEATHPHYFGTVHGAVETGFREAERIIQYYNSKEWMLFCEIKITSMACRIDIVVEVNVAKERAE